MTAVNTKFIQSSLQDFQDYFDIDDENISADSVHLINLNNIDESEIPHLIQNSCLRKNISENEMFIILGFETALSGFCNERDIQLFSDRSSFMESNLYRYNSMDILKPDNEIAEIDEEVDIAFDEENEDEEFSDDLENEDIEDLNDQNQSFSTDSTENFIRFLMNPGDDAYHLQEILQTGLNKPIKRGFKSLLEAPDEIHIILPPVSRQFIELEWKNDLLECFPYGHHQVTIEGYENFLDPKEKGFQYIVFSYQPAHAVSEFPYLLIAGYRFRRGKPEFIGHLGYGPDGNEEDIYELNQYNCSFSIQKIKESQEDYKTDQNTEDNLAKNKIPVIRHRINTDYSVIRNILMKNQCSFLEARYHVQRKKNKHKVLRKIQNLACNHFNNQSFSPAQLASLYIQAKEDDIISLHDTCTMASILSTHPQFFVNQNLKMRTNRTIRVASISSPELNGFDIRRISNLPCNFMKYEWRTKAKRKDIIPYDKITWNGNSWNEILNSILSHFSGATAEEIADELLFMQRDDYNMEPNIYSVACVFLSLLENPDCYIIKRPKSV